MAAVSPCERECTVTVTPPSAQDGGVVTITWVMDCWVGVEDDGVHPVNVTAVMSSPLPRLVPTIVNAMLCVSGASAGWNALHVPAAPPESCEYTDSPSPTSAVRKPRRTGQHLEAVRLGKNTEHR